MRIEEIAEKLARALGHSTTCEMIRCCHCACDCGSAAEQSESLEIYENWKRRSLNADAK
jgi:hypothetical protein